MEHKPDTPDTLAALRHVSLAEVWQRLADLDGERGAFSLLRRSLAALERALPRSEQRSFSEEGRRDE